MRKHRMLLNLVMAGILLFVVAAAKAEEAPVYPIGEVTIEAKQLADGYQWCYRRLFSHRSIWRRRPADHRAVLPYLAMSYLYKRSNLFWHLLIKHQLTGTVWRPLVEVTRRRHVRFRRRLAVTSDQPGTGSVVPAGV